MQENILFLLTVLSRLKYILCDEGINQEMACGLLIKESIIHKGKQQPTRLLSAVLGAVLTLAFHPRLSEFV